MSLYLKFRPQTFDQIVNQRHIVDILQAKIAQGWEGVRNNNYLFYGPRGTGKTSAARIFAKALNCLNLKGGSPCNECANCVAINQNKSIDFVEIDAASHTWVENIREEVIDKAPYPPAHLQKKVYIIDEVHMLSKGAFNALLKIMEEPPAYLVFILATTEIHKVPETIISRCQVFNFKKIPTAELSQHLEYICKTEQMTCDPDAIVTIARMAEWCARDAIKYLDQVSILGDITNENVAQFLGVAPETLIRNFVEAMQQKDLQKLFAIVDELEEWGTDVQNFIKQLLLYIEEHMNEDLETMLSLADVLKNISFSMKAFPQPFIIIKSELYKHFNPFHIYVAADGQSKKKPNSVDSTPAKATKAEIASEEGPKEISSDVEEKDTSAKEEKEVPSEPAKEPNSEPAKANDETSTDTDYTNDELLKKIASTIEKTSIKGLVKSFCLIEKQEEETIYFVVLQKIQLGILQKPENLRVIEEALSKVLDRNVHASLRYQSKDEYFSSLL